ncbi:MAG: hydroxymethylpyrimidine/phosphomethylpyrimidine kinase, partial [Betaproteobacteria bacterium]|nr:hydroxymethylpyrimidine/phosphomethylpyrimidine kinase [Betaproteobacteria bacterium]
MSSSPPAVLAFAASDPTGGAGLQADLLTLASLGCHPLSVLTGLTVQDTRGVESLLAIETAWVERQARRVLEDMPVAAFKLGVLGSPGNARVIAAILAEHPRIPVVLDPVLASGRGDVLADAETIEVLRSGLLPLVTVLTPNSLEARCLAGAAPDA